MARITVVGAGIIGLWQAFRLSQDGHDVRLVEQSGEAFAAASSRLAGAMLAPYCEGEGAEPLITELGLTSVPLWEAAFPCTARNGSLVVAQPRDTGELARFSQMTQGHERIGRDRVAALEPALAGRYAQALFYAQEAHVEPAAAMQTLLERVRSSGAEIRFGAKWNGTAEQQEEKADLIIDCRGYAARNEFADLRAVRGEMAVVETNEIRLSRPVRLLHPRFPLYVVPWPAHRFMIGATVLESADPGAVTLRSALDLLAAAYALHPAFGEARILHFGAGLRPAFPGNAPRIVLRGRTILVNGLYRHGFLLAPVLAELVAHYIRDGAMRQDVFVEDHGER